MRGLDSNSVVICTPESLLTPKGCSVVWTDTVQALIFLVGAISVIMLIIGGLRYVLSSGNATAVEGAKNTIMYALIGIVVAALAFAMVRFVVDKLGG